MTYTVRELAKELDLGEETIRRWIRTGKVECVHQGLGRGGSIVEFDVDAYRNNMYPHRAKHETQLKPESRNINFIINHKEIQRQVIQTEINVLEQQIAELKLQLRNLTTEEL